MQMLLLLLLLISWRCCMNIYKEFKKITEVVFHVPLYKFIKNSLQDQHLCGHSGRSKWHISPHALLKVVKPKEWGCGHLLKNYCSCAVHVCWFIVWHYGIYIVSWQLQCTLIGSGTLNIAKLLVPISINTLLLVALHMWLSGGDKVSVCDV